MNLYGIRNKKTKEPLSVSASDNNECEDCVSISYTFQKYFKGDIIWLVDEKEIAEAMLFEKVDTPWYNAGYNTPQWDKMFVEGLYEVFEVTIPNK